MSLKLPKDPVKSAFHRRGNGSSEKLNNLPKVTQLASGGVRAPPSTAAPVTPWCSDLLPWVASPPDYELSPGRAGAPSPLPFQHLAHGGIRNALQNEEVYSCQLPFLEHLQWARSCVMALYSLYFTVTTDP